MRFSFTDEQEEFRTVLRRFLEDKSPSAVVRRLMETAEGYDPVVWRSLSQDLGLPGLHVPEAYGGQGFGPVELGIVLEEMGRALLCAPYFSSTVLAATAILEAGSEEEKRALLPGIASGETLATLAFTEPNGRWDASGVEAVADPGPDGYRLTGSKSFVLDGHIAELIVVVGRAPGSEGGEGLSLFTVPADADGLERRLLRSVDPTRKLARLELRGVPATVLGEAGAGGPALERTLTLASAMLASEMVGGAQRLHESAVEYAQMRVQFGRQIGSFQSIKHKCADLLLEVELAKSAAYYAAEAAADGAAERAEVAALAKACASEAYMRAAADCIQVHGGMGFTWDNDTHLWFKRAKSSEVFLGDPSYHRERMLRAQGV